MNPDQPRWPEGTSKGGKYAKTVGKRAEIALRDDRRFSPSAVAAFEEAEQADAATLWSSVRHTDPLVRAEAATNPSLTDPQAVELVADRDWIVRWTLAQRTDLAAWHELRTDPDPRVRYAVAGEAAADSATRRQLAADPAVAAIATATHR